jgi:hypothetical protein
VREWFFARSWFRALFSLFRVDDICFTKALGEGVMQGEVWRAGRCVYRVWGTMDQIERRIRAHLQAEEEHYGDQPR